MAQKSEIFVDSNFFISLSNLEDSQHKRAVRIKKKVISQHCCIVITNLIFLEIVTVLSQRTGRQEAISLGEELLSDESVKVIHINPKLHNLSWKVFKEVSRKNTSFVDCSSIAVMGAEGIDKFLTFDNEDFAPLRRKYKFSFF